MNCCLKTLFVISVTLTAVESKASRCQDLWGLSELWGLSAQQALEIASRSEAYNKQITEAVKVIRFLDAAPREFYRVVSVLVPLYKLSYYEDKQKGAEYRHQFKRAISAANWPQAVSLQLRNIFGHRYPNWVRQLSAPSPEFEDLLFQGFAAIPMLKAGSWGADSDPLRINAVERFLRKQELEPDWTFELVLHSKVFREVALRWTLPAHSENAPRDFSPLVLKAVDPDLEEADEDVYTNPWFPLSQQAIEYLDPWSPHADERQIWRRFALVFMAVERRLRERVDSSRYFLRSQDLWAVEADTAASIFRSHVTDTDRLRSDQFIPLMFSTLMATWRMGDYPSMTETKQYIRQGIQQRLEALQAPRDQR